MSQGKIAESKVKTTIVMEKDLKKNLEAFAKKDMRSLNNLMVSILSNYVETKRGTNV